MSHDAHVPYPGTEPRPETVVVERGRRSHQMIIVSVDSTVLGPAVGGCRITRYPSWSDGFADAVRLSSAMTEKTAMAGLDHGGGKAVVALDDSAVGRRSPGAWAALLADVGDVVDGLGGRYVTGPDIGCGPDDLVTIGRRTAHVLCRPVALGGSGDSAAPTALGVGVCIDAVCAYLWPGRPSAATTFAVHGLGRVGSLVAQRLAAAGARLVVTDVDASARDRAAAWGATWVPPEEVTTVEVDVLVPCAVGGVITAGGVDDLRCRAVVGAANNQLDQDTTAELLHRRGILWAPDTVVSAGGIVHSVSRERLLATVEEAGARVRGIGERLTEILNAARDAGTTPLVQARRIAARRLSSAVARA